MALFPDYGIEKSYLRPRIAFWKLSAFQSSLGRISKMAIWTDFSVWLLAFPLVVQGMYERVGTVHCSSWPHLTLAWAFVVQIV